MAINLTIPESFGATYQTFTVISNYHALWKFNCVTLQVQTLGLRIQYDNNVNAVYFQEM